jgi:hypothetical protein
MLLKVGDFVRSYTTPLEVGVVVNLWQETQLKWATVRFADFSVRRGKYTYDVQQVLAQDRQWVYALPMNEYLALPKKARRWLQREARKR